MTMDGEPQARKSLDQVIADARPIAPTAQFLTAAAELGIEFDEDDLDQLGLFLACLLSANEIFNLTAVRDPDQAWERHILDSLTLLPLLAELPKGARVIDVGSGGGLPGLVLATLMGDLQFALLEATGKKVEFLQSTVKRMSLSNVQVLQGRAEQYGQDRGQKTGGPEGRINVHRENYDAVTARAVGKLATVAELTIPLAKTEGIVLLIKGEKAEEELAAGAKALEILKASHRMTIQTATGRIVVLGKDARTPRTYPRRDGEPKRVPLGC